MSEYLRNLPEGTSLGSIFEDLHGRAVDLVGELEVQRLADQTEEGDQEAISGTDLSLGWSQVETNGTGSYLTTHVLANIEGESHHLMSTMSFYPGNGLDSKPVAVSANRGDETGGDYLLRRQVAEQGEIDMVTIALQSMGAGDHIAEPTGHTTRPPETPLAVLLDREGIETSKRLEVVTQGILNSMEMVEIIRTGTPAIDAFRVMGRPVVTAA